MTVEEMLGKRDVQSAFMSTCQGVLENSKLLPSEDLELYNTIDEYKKYIFSKFKEYNTNIIIQFGWAFTPDYYHRLVELYEYSNKEDSELYCLIMFPIMGVIYTSSEETYKYVVETFNKLIPKYILLSDLNLVEVFESDNAVEFKFNDKLEVIKFEEKPKSVRLIKDLENSEFSEEEVKKDE